MPYFPNIIVANFLSIFCTCQLVIIFHLIFFYAQCNCETIMKQILTALKLKGSRDIKRGAYIKLKRLWEVSNGSLYIFFFYDLNIINTKPLIIFVSLLFDYYRLHQLLFACFWRRERKKGYCNQRVSCQYGIHAFINTRQRLHYILFSDFSVPYISRKNCSMSCKCYKSSLQNIYFFLFQQNAFLVFTFLSYKWKLRRTIEKNTKNICVFMIYHYNLYCLIE